MDPTQTVIDVIELLADLEQAHADGEDTTELRAAAVEKLHALANWLGPLNGFPPAISEIDFTDEDA